MNKIMLIAVAMLMSIATFAKDIKTVVLTTDPIMHCANCENKVKENLKFVPGIKSIVPCAETQSITITYDADKTSVEKMQASLKKAGYTATVKTDCGKQCQGEKQCGGKCKEGAAAEKKCCKQEAAAEMKCCKQETGEKKCCGKCQEGAGEKKCCKQETSEKKCCKEGASEKKCDGSCKK